jgi:hypothetical protein
MSTVHCYELDALQLHACVNFSGQTNQTHKVTLLWVQPQRQLTRSMSAASERALRDIEVLQQVFSFLGPGYWLFASPVSKLWKQWYEKLELAPLPSYGKGIQVVLQRNQNCIQTTSFGAAFQSAACVRLACEHGLQAQFHNYRLQGQAGRPADLETLMVAQDLGFPVTDDFVNSAAAAGHVSVLEQLHFTQGIQLPERASVSAAASGRLDVLRWLQRSGMAFDRETAVIAASCGHIAVLQYLLSEHAEFVLDESLCRIAALSARLSVLQYLREAGCPWSDTIADDAAICGSVEVMQWLREQGVAFSTTTLKQAAKYGNLELVQYLCSEGCPWDETVTATTCEIGQIDTLRWLVQHGCPIEVSTCCVTAAAMGSIDALEYLQDAESLIYVPMLQFMLTVAGAFGQLAAAQHLRQQGAEWPPVLSLDGLNWTGQLIEWARAEGCTSPISV